MVIEVLLKDEETARHPRPKIAIRNNHTSAQE
jgi:hypothetical protein